MPVPVIPDVDNVAYAEYDSDASVRIVCVVFMVPVVSIIRNNKARLI